MAKEKMKRAIIIAKGEVQGVGYRGKVFKIARKLNITGFVENIKPYDLRIIAEGEKEKTCPLQRSLRRGLNPRGG